jgi:hypothetical protein
MLAGACAAAAASPALRMPVAFVQWLDVSKEVLLAAWQPFLHGMLLPLLRPSSPRFLKLLQQPLQPVFDNPRSCTRACCELQIFGPESSGKTTLAMHAIAEVQKQGGVACFIDAEHAFDAVYAEVSCTVALQLHQESGNIM